MPVMHTATSGNKQWMQERIQFTSHHTHIIPEAEKFVYIII